MKTLQPTISALLRPGKGILAADESFPTIAKRFKELRIPNDEPSRRSYREMLFTTPRLSSAISGVILFDETIRQRTSKGVPMARLLEEKGIVPGIKVDAGTEALPGNGGERFTMGLDGLRARLDEYYRLGARFTKWRAVYSIGQGTPTRACIGANTRAHALFAALSQQAGLVPIVEPEVLMEGRHGIGQCEEVTTRVLQDTFAALDEQRVSLEGMLLKSGMVLPGSESRRQPTAQEVAEATLRCFSRSVPSAVPGIVFLSGGQRDIPGTQRLNAISRASAGPWKLTFSFGRALQDPAMKAWRGSRARLASGQRALARRARCNGLAVRGKYSAKAERAG